MEKTLALLKGMVYLFSSWSLLLLDFVIPKKKDIWLIASHSGMVGNTRFFAEHVLENHQDITVYFFAYNRGGALKATEDYFLKRFGKRFWIYKERNARSLAAALKAGVVFVSHDLYKDVGFPLTTLGNRRTVINLWHGIAIKKHWLAKKYTVFTIHRHRARQFSKVIASSAADALAKAAIFGKTLDDIWITGNPRNDMLAPACGRMSPDLFDQEKTLKEELGGRKLVLYAPTWRHYQENFAPFNGETQKRLSRVLDKHNAVMGFRLHEKDEYKFRNVYQTDPAVLNLSHKRYPEVQVVLRNTRLLVTDYSSVWIDYLLTGKSVIGYWYDLEQYRKKRGILWDLIELFPGVKVYSQAELVMVIEKLLQSGDHFVLGDESKYLFVKSLFHKHTEGKSSERIINLLKKNKNF